MRARTHNSSAMLGLRSRVTRLRPYFPIRATASARASPCGEESSRANRAAGSRRLNSAAKPLVSGLVESRTILVSEFSARSVIANQFALSTSAEALQNLDVIGALESLRIAQVVLAHSAANGGQRGEIPRFKPFPQFGEQDRHLARSMPQQR